MRPLRNMKVELPGHNITLYQSLCPMLDALQNRTHFREVSKKSVSSAAASRLCDDPFFTSTGATPKSIIMAEEESVGMSW